MLLLFDPMLGRDILYCQGFGNFKITYLLFTPKETKSSRSQLIYGFHLRSWTSSSAKVR